MLSEGEIRGARNLAVAILNSAFKDAEAGYSPSKIEDFAMSEWCEMLCNIVGIPWTAYRRELGKIVCRYIEDCRTRRLKTYELIKVLKDGKSTGADKTKGN